MKKALIVIGIVLLTIIAEAVIFGLTTLIASAINHVDVYGQLRLWFGYGSNFAKIFVQ